MLKQASTLKHMYRVLHRYGLPRLHAGVTGYRDRQRFEIHEGKRGSYACQYRSQSRLNDDPPRPQRSLRSLDLIAFRIREVAVRLDVEDGTCLFTQVGNLVPLVTLRDRQVS